MVKFSKPTHRFFPKAKGHHFEKIIRENWEPMFRQVFLEQAVPMMKHSREISVNSIIFDAEIWVFCSWTAPKTPVFSGQVGHREGVPLPQTRHRAERFRYH